MYHHRDIPSFEKYIICRRELQNVADDAIPLIIDQPCFDTTLIDPDWLAGSPTFSLSPASSYSGDFSGYPANIWDQEPTYITTGSGLDHVGGAHLPTLSPDVFKDTTDMGQIYQGGISPSDIFLAQQSYPDLEYLTDLPEQKSASFNDSQGFISEITAQQPFSQPNVNSIVSDLVSRETTPPSYISSAPPPYPDLQQTAGLLRKFPCKHCDRSFATRWNLKTHMELHNPDRVKPHICPHEGCHYASARKNDLKRHIGSCSYA